MSASPEARMPSHSTRDLIPPTANTGIETTSYAAAKNGRFQTASNGYA